MNYSDKDVIVAPATPVGQKAPLAIIRVSGQGTRALVAGCFKAKKKKPEKPWVMRYGYWSDHKGTVDEVMVVEYDPPNTYTGQEMAEIFCHGNPLFVEEIETSLIQKGARRAKPGEFTMRAVLNGKKTLLEAEGLQSLLSAHTRFQADMVRRQSHGPLVGYVRERVEEILQIQAHIEATIDYGEEDIDALDRDGMLAKLKKMVSDFKDLYQTATFAKGLNRGFRVLITGEPNVGKSTLFNYMVRQERAIVTELPGTTRDLISETIELEGLPIVLIDSAGVRESDDRIETMGIEKIFELLHDVDLVLYLTSVDEMKPPYPQLKAFPKEKYLQVVTKSDLDPVRSEKAMVVSVKENLGLKALEKEIVLRLAADFGDRSIYLINQRQEEIVSEVLQQLQEAAADYQAGFGEEVLSSYLNTARSKLGELTGETTVEDILDRMFSNFCLGK